MFDTARSCIVMRHKMILKVGNCTASDALGNPYGSLGPVAPLSVSEEYMGPGKLILKDGAWWWARCKVDAALKEDGTSHAITGYDNQAYDYSQFEEPVALALSPMNAFAPIELTTFEMSGLNARDDNKRFTSCFL